MAERGKELGVPELGAKCLDFDDVIARVAETLGPPSAVGDEESRAVWLDRREECGVALEPAPDGWRLFAWWGPFGGTHVWSTFCLAPSPGVPPGRCRRSPCAVRKTA
jgi:hypothetical protein